MTDIREETETLPFDELRHSGILWLINTSIFHPRGMALALHYDDDGNCTGWVLYKNKEASVFLDADANESFDNFNNFLAKHFPVEENEQ